MSGRDLREEPGVTRDRERLEGMAVRLNRMLCVCVCVLLSLEQLIFKN